MMSESKVTTVAQLFNNTTVINVGQFLIVRGSNGFRILRIKSFIIEGDNRYVVADLGEFEYPEDVDTISFNDICGVI